MRIVGLILSILGGVALVNLVVWLPILRRLRRVPAELRRQLEASGEVIVLGPERANYEGATAEYGRVKGTGIVVLTARQLVFRRAIGKPLAISRADIASVRSEKWFNGSRVANREFVVLTTTAGTDVGFLFADRPAWLDALGKASAPSKSPRDEGAVPARTNQP